MDNAAASKTYFELKICQTSIIASQKTANMHMQNMIYKVLSKCYVDRYYQLGEEILD